MSDNVPDCPLCLDNYHVRDNRQHNEGCDWRCARDHEGKDFHRPPGNGDATWHHFNDTAPPEIFCPKCGSSNVDTYIKTREYPDNRRAMDLGLTHFCLDDGCPGMEGFTVRDGKVVEPEKNTMRALFSTEQHGSKTVLFYDGKQVMGIHHWQAPKPVKFSFWLRSYEWNVVRGTVSGGALPSPQLVQAFHECDPIGHSADLLELHGPFDPIGGEGGSATRKDTEPATDGGRASHKPPSPRIPHIKDHTRKMGRDAKWIEDVPTKRSVLAICGTLLMGVAVIGVVATWGPQMGLQTDLEAYAASVGSAGVGALAIWWFKRLVWGRRST